MEITDNFYAVIHKKEFFHEFTPFPCYDEGGAAVLLQLKNNVFASKKILEQPKGELSLTSHIKPIESLEKMMISACSYKIMKSNAIQYLVKLTPKNRLSMGLYSRIFKFLEDDEVNFKLNQNENVALVKIIIKITSNENYPLYCSYTFSDIHELLEEVNRVHQKCGEEIIINFCNAVIHQREVSLDEAIQGFKLLHLLSDDLELEDEISDKLNIFSLGEISLTAFLNELERLVPDANSDVIDNEGDIDILLARFAGNDPNVRYPLCEGDLKEMRGQYITIKGLCEEWKNLRLGKLVNMALGIKEKSKDSPLDQKDILRLVAIGRLALRIKFSIYLYNTQILTVLGQLIGSGKSIAQVKTGEGKSMIVTLLAFVLSAQGKNIHIISSSPQLAIRDQEKCFNFFKTFGISTSHICTHQPDAPSFKAQILYGTATDFEFAVMREMLYFEDLFPKDKMKKKIRFDAAIIDEVDNLTIDTQLNSARLSSPSEISYEWVYAPILVFVKNNFKDAKKDPITGNLPLNSANKLKIHMSEYMNGRFKDLVAKLSEKQLERWIHSARRALFTLEELNQYVIKEERGKDGRLQKSILIIDAENTGRGLIGCRWSNGTHEFVEAKHEIKVQQESLIPISLTNSVFYLNYNSLYGLTGTLGSKLEREQIKDLYGMNSFDVPSHRPQQRVDIPPIIVDTNRDYFNYILKTVEECQKKGRPLLVICQTIKESKILETFLKMHEFSFEMLNEMQTKDEEDILEDAGLPCVITVATNTAGRGTDIKLKGNSYKNGGLHVLLTFFPDSERVEVQARGRAGRQGEPGSSAMILFANSLGIKAHQNIHLPHIQAEIIMNIKVQRELKVQKMKVILMQQSKIEKLKFSCATQFFSAIKKFNCLLARDRFLEERSVNLSNRILLVGKELKVGLNSKDLQIAKDAFELFSGKIASRTHWLTLLKQIGDRIQTKMINDWAINFYQETENLAYELEYNRLGPKIEKLFINNKNQWEKYLDDSGNGIIQYLCEITDLDLKYI